MKEIESYKKDQVEIVDQKQMKKEVKWMGAITARPGHQCFELNVDTGDIELATIEVINVDYGTVLRGSPLIRKKVLVKDRCLYTSALNMKNAIKRFKKMAKR